jgi:hypothetical protein
LWQKQTFPAFVLAQSERVELDSGHDHFSKADATFFFGKIGGGHDVFGGDGF